MRLRNAFRLLLNNFSNVYKLLLFRLVTNVLMLSLAYVVISFGLHTIFSSAEAEAIVDLAGEFFHALVSGNVSFLGTFQEKFTGALADFLSLLGTNIGSIVGSVIGVSLLYLAARFLNGTAVFAMGSIYNDRMSSYGKTGFASAYFKHVGKAALYQIIYVPLAFLYDLLALLACWFFFFYTPSLFHTWEILTIFLGLALSMLAFVCLEALKMTFISAWIPAVITDGCGVAEGMKKSFRMVHGFGGRFSSFFMTIYLIVVLNVLFAVCTFGSMLIVTVPASYILLLALQLVYYYEDTGKKFFLSFRKISGADGKPEGMGD